jgi:hypothetical protein
MAAIIRRRICAEPIWVSAHRSEESKGRAYGGVCAVLRFAAAVEGLREWRRQGIATLPRARFARSTCLRAPISFAIRRPVGNIVGLAQLACGQTAFRAGDQHADPCQDLPGIVASAQPTSRRDGGVGDRVDQRRERGILEPRHGKRPDHSANAHAHRSEGGAQVDTKLHAAKAAERGGAPREPPFGFILERSRGVALASFQKNR